jgi:hypothetical protein
MPRALLPLLTHLVPVLSLVLAIGLIDAVFWRGWMPLRRGEVFGFLPALVPVGAVHRRPYGIPKSVQGRGALLWIGITHAVGFRIAKRVLLLWPVFQPVGQLRGPRRHVVGGTVGTPSRRGRRSGTPPR